MSISPQMLKPWLIFGWEIENYRRKKTLTIIICDIIRLGLVIIFMYKVLHFQLLLTSRIISRITLELIHRNKQLQLGGPIIKLL